ncbi:MAG: transcriptional repressor [Ruminococcaceae bacterium]|nr:transcriptional repressor [Oscillospiraceae bacterium]
MPASRLTKQKQEFRRFLELNREKEMTVSEIAELLKEAGSEMGIATVYRAVRRLEEEGVLVRSVNGATSKTTYRYAGPDTSVRSIHRVFCTSCGKITDLSYKFTDRLEKSVSDATGYSLTEHQIMFYGLCENCKN